MQEEPLLHTLGCRVFAVSLGKVPELRKLVRGVHVSPEAVIQAHVLLEEPTKELLTRGITQLVSNIVQIRGSIHVGFANEPHLFRLPLEKVKSSRSRKEQRTLSIHIHKSRNQQLQHYLLDRWREKEISAMPRESSAIENAIDVAFAADRFTTMELIQLILELFEIAPSSAPRANLLFFSKKKSVEIALESM